MSVTPDGLNVPTDNPATLREGFSVIRRGASEQRFWFGIAVIGSALYGILTTGMAWVIGRLTSDVIEPAVARKHLEPGDLWLIGLAVGGTVALTVAGVLTRRVAAAIAMMNLNASYRRRVTRQYLRLPLSWHHAHPSGQLLSNANADVEATWQVFAPLPMALGVIVMLIFGIAQMLLVDGALAIVGLLIFPLLLLANLTYQRIQSPRMTRAQQLRADVSEVAHESFEAGQVIKSLGREDVETERFSTQANELRAANIRVGRTRAVFEPIIDGIPILGIIIVLVVGAHRVNSGAATAAAVAQIAYLFSLLSFPVRALGWVLSELPRSVVGWRRVNAVLSADGQVAYGTATFGADATGELAADHVSYHYDQPSPLDAEGHPLREEPERYLTLDDVTLDVPSGSTIALVGPTGSGKSTITSLALRLLDPTTGTMRVNGLDLRELAQGQLSQVAALVAQQAFLFDDTVRGNVTLGLAASDEEVWAALEVAAAQDFVHDLPKGLETRIGERGTTLSGGQRQRLALARAILRKPRLLVLDDATSAVDPSVEQFILHRLREVSAGMTVLIVAYRPATIALADAVVFIDQGRVLARGSDEQLRAEVPAYQALVSAYAHRERELTEDDEHDLDDRVAAIDRELDQQWDVAMELELDREHEGERP